MGPDTLCKSFPYSWIRS